MSFPLLARGEPFHSSVEDIDRHIFSGIHDLHGKFFANKPLGSKAMGIVEKAWPGVQNQNDIRLTETVTAWLQRVQAEFEKKAGVHAIWHVHHSGGSQNVLMLSESQELDNWADVAVLGLLRQGTEQQGILQLSRYARSVFYSQPSRLFLHGFLVRGQKAQLWLFDRSGIYGSCHRTVRGPNDPYLLAMVGCMFMNKGEWGMSPLVHRNGEHDFVSLPCKHGSKNREDIFVLCAKIFERVPGTLVGDGLTVYRARRAQDSDEKYAVKFKWSGPSERNEINMLNLLKERNVWGVVRLDAYYVGTSTHILHDNLILGLGNPLALQAEIDASDDGFEERTMKSLSQDNRNEPRVFACTVVSPQGRSLHNYETTLEVLLALRDAVKAHRSLYQDGKILHRDINPSNIIIPSYDPNMDGDHAARGVLIDFDMAKENSQPVKPHQAVGTYIFQAIGVLQAYLPDNPHTYRHDLESFLYTFLFLAVAPRPVPEGENQLQLPESSVLREWYKGRLVEKADRKIQDMKSADEFRARIVSEFTPEFQWLGLLAERLREILFPVDEDGEILTGTDMTEQGTNGLYDAVIGAFEDAALEHEIVVQRCLV